MTDKPTQKEIDDHVYEIRQAGQDDTYSLASAVLAKWGQPAQKTVTVVPATGDVWLKHDDDLRYVRRVLEAGRQMTDVDQRAAIDIVHGLRVTARSMAVDAKKPDQAAEPVAIYHGRCTIDCGEHGHLDMELLKMIPAGSKLYTTPQPTQPQAGAGEPVAWLRNTTDPQPHAVTNLKYRSAVDAQAGVEYIPVFAAHQPVEREPLVEARRLFDAGWRAAALFCDREDVVADGIIGFGACPQFEAAFSAANGIKGGQHDR